MDNKTTVGESNLNSIGRNYNKIAVLSEMLRGREVVIRSEDEEEYKSLMQISSCCWCYQNWY